MSFWCQFCNKQLKSKRNLVQHLNSCDNELLKDFYKLNEYVIKLKEQRYNHQNISDVNIDSGNINNITNNITV